MRRLARHARPDLLAIRALPCAERVDTRQQEQGERARLYERNDAQAVYERCVPNVYGADAFLDDRQILTVELRDVVTETWVLTSTHISAAVDRIQRRVERCVDRVRRIAIGIGDDDGHLRLTDVPREIEQRGRRIRARVRERLVDARVHAARPLRFTPKLGD